MTVVDISHHSIHVCSKLFRVGGGRGGVVGLVQPSPGKKEIHVIATFV